MLYWPEALVLAFDFLDRLQMRRRDQVACTPGFHCLLQRSHHVVDPVRVARDLLGHV